MLLLHNLIVMVMAYQHIPTMTMVMISTTILLIGVHVHWIGQIRYKWVKERTKRFLELDDEPKQFIHISYVYIVSFASRVIPVG